MRLGPLDDADWIAATLEHYPVPVMQKAGRTREAGVWCEEQWGHGGGRMVGTADGLEQYLETECQWARVPGGLYCFKDERLAFAFKMRWG